MPRLVRPQDIIAAALNGGDGQARARPGACALVAAALALGVTAAPRHALAQAGETLTVALTAQGPSGVSGTATLTDTGEGLQVEIVLVGGPPGVSQPVHIHRGGCGDQLGDVVYPLESVLDGASTTLLRRVALADVEVGHAINVHRSRDDIATYVACGVVTAETGRVGSGPAATAPRTDEAAEPAKDVTAGAETDAAAGAASGVGGRVQAGPTALPRTGRGELLGLTAVLGALLGILGLGLRRRWTM